MYNCHVVHSFGWITILGVHTFAILQCSSGSIHPRAKAKNSLFPSLRTSLCRCSTSTAAALGRSSLFNVKSVYIYAAFSANKCECVCKYGPDIVVVSAYLSFVCFLFLFVAILRRLLLILNLCPGNGNNRPFGSWRGCEAFFGVCSTLVGTLANWLHQLSALPITTPTHSHICVKQKLLVKCTSLYIYLQTAKSGRWRERGGWSCRACNNGKFLI